MNPVETYIRELFDIRRSGEAVKETSYYAPLATLLNEVGKTLKPQVRCIINIRNRGAGIPDGGLFTAEQLRRDTDANPFLSQLPARGVIEVKGTVVKISSRLPRVNRSRAILGSMVRCWSPTIGTLCW